MGPMTRHTCRHCGKPFGLGSGALPPEVYGGGFYWVCCRTYYLADPDLFWSTYPTVTSSGPVSFVRWDDGADAWTEAA